MKIDIIKKYRLFFERTKKEPFVILQGSKRSGKTFAILQKIGLEFFKNGNKRTQCFSESPKQQNFGLLYDFKTIFNPLFENVKINLSQKTFKYNYNELSFINIPNNVNANNIANSLGACDVRYVNECNMFAKETIEKLIINNREQTIFDFNPYRKFWIDDFITALNRTTRN